MARPDAEEKGLSVEERQATYGGFFDPAAPIPMVNTAKWRIRLAAILSFPAWIIAFHVLGVLMAGQLPTIEEDAIPVTFDAPISMQVIMLVVALGLIFSSIFSVFVQKYWTVWSFSGFGLLVVAFQTVLVFINPPTVLPLIVSAVSFFVWAVIFVFSILHALRSQGYLDKLSAEAAPQDWDPTRS